MLGFAGVSLQGDALAFDPHLPEAWRSLGFTVQWRGRHLKVLTRANTFTCKKP